MRFLLAVAALVAPMTAQTPKLLVVDLDDLGKEFLELVNPPFLESFASVARTYDRFYTSPVCTPTRASMNYGVRPSHPELQTPWLVGPAFEPHHSPTGSSLVPLARALTDHGVSCAKVGKWHLADPDQLTHPFKLGFESYHGVMGNTDNYYNYVVNHNAVAEPTTNTYLTQLETDRAIDAMGAGYDFVSLSYHAIHLPFHKPPAYLYPDTINTIDHNGQAKAMLHALDTELARLANAVVQHGYHVIMFSDNGGLQELGGLKGSVKEQGVNCALWVYGPGVQQGHDSSLVGAYDIYATVLDFFGVPRGPNMGPQSVSFLPTVLGIPGTRQSIYAERYTTNGVDPALDEINWARAVIGPNYKLRLQDGIRSLNRVSFESDNLFDDSPLEPTLLDTATFLHSELDVWTD